MMKKIIITCAFSFVSLSVLSLPNGDENKTNEAKNSGNKNEKSQAFGFLANYIPTSLSSLTSIPLALTNNVTSSIVGLATAPYNFASSFITAPQPQPVVNTPTVNQIPPGNFARLPQYSVNLFTEYLRDDSASITNLSQVCSYFNQQMKGYKKSIVLTNSNKNSILQNESYLLKNLKEHIDKKTGISEVEEIVFSQVHVASLSEIFELLNSRFPKIKSLQFSNVFNESNQRKISWEIITFLKTRANNPQKFSVIKNIGFQNHLLWNLTNLLKYFKDESRSLGKLYSGLDSLSFKGMEFKQINSIDVDNLLYMISSSTHLKKLNLSHTQFEPNLFLEIFYAQFFSNTFRKFPINKELEELDMSDLNITADEFDFWVNGDAQSSFEAPCSSPSMVSSLKSFKLSLAHSLNGNDDLKIFQKFLNRIETKSLKQIEFGFTGQRLNTDDRLKYITEMYLKRISF